MFKYAGLILDQGDDLACDIVNPKEEVPLEIIKTASDKPKKHFALRILKKNGQVDKKFPLDTPYDTYLSALYFENTCRQLPASLVPKIAGVIKKAMLVHGIDIDRQKFPKIAAVKAAQNVEPVLLITKLYENEPTLADLEKTAKKLTYQERKTLPDSAFALVIKTPSGRKIRKYPLHDEAHVRNAIVRFAQHYDKLPPKYRRIVARKIKEKAKQYGIEISPDNVLNKYASEKISPYFWEALNTRIEKTEHPGYRWLSKTASTMEPDRVAELLEAFDKLSGFDKHWDAYGDPYETVFGQHKASYDRLAKLAGVNQESLILKYIEKMYGKKIADLYKNNKELAKRLIPELPTLEEEE